MRIGLRIDVDTLRGTRYGVPNLCGLLSAHSIQATFFFCVGPDNMGRHLWRLIRPAFLKKMLRTSAPGLYGWDILFRGTLGRGPVIGEKMESVIRSAAESGHEIGLHAWDHHAWQAHIDAMDDSAIRSHLTRGVEMLARIIGRPPSCSAVPGWKCTEVALLEKERFRFQYNSDCRGRNIFRPCVNGQGLSTPQIPVTLPTYDEVIGTNRISARDYNAYMLSLLDPAKLNVLTIHAEVEGIGFSAMFDEFVRMGRAKGAEFVPLGRLLADASDIPRDSIAPMTIPGRDGWVACQTPAA